MNPQKKHCCEAPRSMLSNYFGKKQVLRGTFGEIWRIQILIYPQTSIEPRYGAFYLTNEVSAHGLGLLVQLSWRVAPPFRRMSNTSALIFRKHQPKICLCCTLRSRQHKIPTMIRTFSCGFENTHACKWISDNLLGITHMSAFLENCQKIICIYCCSKTQRTRSLRVSNLGDKFVPYILEEKDLFPWIWEQPCKQIDIRQFFGNADICVNLGKLSEIHLHVWLFSNPRGKVLIIVGISCSPDLRVQPMGVNLV